MSEIIYNLDKKILFWVNGLHNDFLNTFFVILTDKKYVILPVLLLIFFVIYKDKKKGLYIILATAITIGLTDLISSKVIKYYFMRKRPCQVLEGLNFWRKHGNPFWVITDGISSYKRSYAFTSSHAANSMAFAVFIGLFYKKYLPLLVGVSIFIGISRLYVGAHWPTDVLGGFIVGTFIALWMKYFFDLIHRKIVYNKKMKPVK